MLLREERWCSLTLLITALQSHNATLTNILIRESSKSKSLSAHGLSACACACLRAITFEFSHVLTASYHITQPLMEIGGSYNSPAAESMTPSYEACLCFSHAVITYVVFCFLLSPKWANIMREKANERKEQDATWLSFSLRAHLGFGEPRRGLKWEAMWKEEDCKQGLGFSGWETSVGL